jgi:hypothetical protein
VLLEVTLMIVVAILPMTMITEGLREMLWQKIGAGIIVDENTNNKQTFEDSLLQDSLKKKAVGSLLNVLLHQTLLKVTQKTSGGLSEHLIMCLLLTFPTMKRTLTAFSTRSAREMVKKQTGMKRSTS